MTSEVCPANLFHGFQSSILATLDPKDFVGLPAVELKPVTKLVSEGVVEMHTCQ